MKERERERNSGGENDGEEDDGRVASRRRLRCKGGGINIRVSRLSYGGGERVLCA